MPANGRWDLIRRLKVKAVLFDLLFWRITVTKPKMHAYDAENINIQLF